MILRISRWVSVWGNIAPSPRADAKDYGILFWLELCHVMMTNIAEQDMQQSAAAEQLHKMLVLSLSGIGVIESTASKIGEQF